MYRLFGRVGVQLQPPPIHNNAAGEGLGTASFSSWQATAGGGRAWADADFADINVVVKAKLPNGALCHQGGGAGGLASLATAVPAHAAVLSVASLELSSQICSRRASRAQQEKKQPLGQQEQESDQVLGEEVGGRKGCSWRCQGRLTQLPCSFSWTTRTPDGATSLWAEA